MKIKAIATMLLAALMIVSVAACGKNEETTAEQTKEETTIIEYWESDEVLGEEIVPEG